MPRYLPHIKYTDRWMISQIPHKDRMKKNRTGSCHYHFENAPLNDPQKSVNRSTRNIKNAVNPAVEQAIIDW